MEASEEGAKTCREKESMQLESSNWLLLWRMQSLESLPGLNAAKEGELMRLNAFHSRVPK